jgi:hypothetical protein
MKTAKSPFTYVTLSDGSGLDINITQIVSLHVKTRRLTLVGHSSPYALDEHSAKFLQHQLNTFSN